tara:strand:+ start:424 stop:807 length:384 start_codon:yes stop_codon:yes gene_type:complete
MTKERRRLAKILRWLKKNFPGKRPVRLIVSMMPKDEMDCAGVYYPPVDSKSAFIRLNKDQTRSEKIYTLLHEWAHYRIDPLAESVERDHGGHPNAFYLEYGRIERAYYKALDGELKIRKGKTDAPQS